jgi:hypothetical protein
MSDEHASGMEPEYVAEQIIKAVVLKMKEFTIDVLGHRLAIVLRGACPSLIFWMLERRARKLQNKMD